MAKKKIDTRLAGLDASVYVARTFADSPWLHYGMWEPGERPTMPTLRHAQERYVEKLLSLFPPPPQRVLDIGGGTGEMAGLLSERGYQVEMLTPSEVQVEAARDRWGDKIVVHHSRFEDFPDTQTFDVLLFSESFQYVSMKGTMRRLAGLLNPGGVVIIADCFRTDAYKRGDLMPGGGHKYSRFIEEVEAHGLEIVSNLDVTEAVAPSMILDQQLYRDVLSPIFGQLDSGLRVSRPLLHWFLRTGFRLMTKSETRDRLQKRLEAEYRSPENFKRANTYRFVVLRPR